MVYGDSTIEEVEIGGGGCGQDRVAGKEWRWGLIDKLVVPVKLLPSRICEVWSSFGPENHTTTRSRRPLEWRLMTQQH